MGWILVHDDLALNHASKKWTMPIKSWALALQQFAIHFEGRVNL